MRLARNARKHGIDRDDIRQVIARPLRTVQQGEAVLHIGLTARRDLIEVVVAPCSGGVGDPVTVVHAMRLRQANFHHLRGLRGPDPRL